MRSAPVIRPLHTRVHTRVGRGALALSALGFALAAMTACSSKQGSTPGSGGGVTGAPQGTNPSGVNPDGVAYPSAGIGTGQRGLDTTGKPNTGRHGDVIKNYAFLGYPNGDATKPLQTVQLADFYDPTGQKYKVLHIIAAAEWCGPCNDETSQTLAALKQTGTNYTALGVVYVQALVEGFTENNGATTQDLDAWITKYHPTFTEVLDPEAETLGVFFDAAAVPFNADIDARSMEILQAGTGEEPPNAVMTWVDWVNANPATKYP